MSDRRGVLYMVWGDGVEPLLERSRKSLAAFHPELSVHVERLGEGAGLLDKAAMLERTPFEETLFLDADTVVMGRLDWAFEQAARVGLACGICECPWARRYGGIDGDWIEYNTGVLFFNEKARVGNPADVNRGNVRDDALHHVIHSSGFRVLRSQSELLSGCDVGVEVAALIVRVVSPVRVVQ